MSTTRKKTAEAKPKPLLGDPEVSEYGVKKKPSRPAPEPKAPLFRYESKEKTKTIFMTTYLVVNSVMVVYGAVDSWEPEWFSIAHFLWPYTFATMAALWITTREE